MFVWQNVCVLNVFYFSLYFNLFVWPKNLWRERAFFARLIKTKFWPLVSDTNGKCAMRFACKRIVERNFLSNKPTKTKTKRENEFCQFKRNAYSRALHICTNNARKNDALQTKRTAHNTNTLFFTHKNLRAQNILLCACAPCAQTNMS